MVDVGKAQTIEQSKAGCLQYANTKPDHTKNHTLTDEQMQEAKQGRKMMGKEMINRGLPLFADFIQAIKSINPKKCAIVSSKIGRAHV